MKKNNILIILFLVCSLSVFALPVSYTNMQQDSGVYTNAAISNSDWVSLEIDCVDCTFISYCIDKNNTCLPTTEYVTPFNFSESVFVRYFSTNGDDIETTKSNEIIINTPMVLTDYEFGVSSDILLSYEYDDFEIKDSNIHTLWYVNGASIPENNDMTTLSSTYYSNGDLIRVIFNLYDAKYTSEIYDKTITIGDGTHPMVTDYNTITKADDDNLYDFYIQSIDAESSIKRIIYLYSNPAGEDVFFDYLPVNQSDDDYYHNFIQFDELGVWTYKRIFVEDTLGNINSIVVNTPIEIIDFVTTSGGSGGSSNVEDDGFDVEVFHISPTTKDYYASQGDTILGEVLVRNTYVNDISLQLYASSEDLIYSWFSFDDLRYIKSTSVNIEKTEGISGNSAYVNYVIKVPDNVQNGLYTGTITVSAKDEIKTHTINVNVGANPFMVFVSKPLYSSYSFTFTLGHLLSIIIFISVVGILIFNNLKDAGKLKKKGKKDEK